MSSLNKQEIINSQINCFLNFREAFSCFHYSTADPKGSDCIEKFADMQVCMQGYPELYDKSETAVSALEDSEKSAENSENPPVSENEESAGKSAETPEQISKDDSGTNSTTKDTEPSKTDSKS